VKSLHSPVWASRGKNIAPVEVDGLSSDESRRFLDRLEAHVLQSKYRYDHIHKPGDVTLWSNFATLHNAPACKSVINDPVDVSHQLQRPAQLYLTQTRPRGVD
jgi:hypothetical protein